jgi:hypothetical protein
MAIEDIMKVYFKKKQELSKKILECIKDPNGKKKVEELLNLF